MSDTDHAHQSQRSGKGGDSLLVLGVKPGEAITVGDNVEIRILGIVNRRLVRVGIEAPLEVLVLRSKLTKRDRVDGDSRAHQSDEEGSP